MDDPDSNPAPPAKKKYKKVDDDLKKPRKERLLALAQQAIRDRRNNGGRLPDGYFGTVLEGPSLTSLHSMLQMKKIDVKNEIRKLENKATINLQKRVPDDKDWRMAVAAAGGE